MIVHGYAEHGDRYAEMAAELNREGFDVWAADHYGHGQSAGQRADVSRFELFVEDLHEFIVHTVQKKSSASPLFLYGHSMGGAITLLYASQHQDLLKGILLSGPIVRPGAQTSSLERKAAHVLRKIVPSLQFKPFHAHLLCHDELVVEAYMNDPLVYNGKMKVRMGDELLRAGEMLTDEVLKNLTLPMLILHGTEDQVVLPDNSKLVHSLASSQDKTLKLFDGMYHEIHNEASKKELFETVRDWLSARSS